MKRGLIIKLCVVAVIVVGGLVSYAVRPREPVYQGQPLSFWFGQLGNATSGQAAIALQEMGPAAVPVLLKKARSKNGDSVSEKLYRTIYDKAPIAIKRRMPMPKPIDDTFPYRVASALRVLGPAAVPQLINGMDDGNENVRLTALRAAGLMGPKAVAAVPAFIKLLNDPNGRIRVEAITALDVMGPPKKLAMSALLGALNDSDRGPGPSDVVYVRANAARVLGEIGPEARAALPGLNKVLGATDSYTRVHAAIAIWRIASDTNMIPALIAELDTTADAPTCSWILSAFGEMGPVAKPAIPAILRKVESSRGVSNVHGIDLSSVGHSALKKIDPEAAANAGVK